MLVTDEQAESNSVYSVYSIQMLLLEVADLSNPRLRVRR